MDFVDRMLVKLSDPATQTGVFDAVALEQIAAAAYDTSQATLDGPYRAVFEEVRLGLSVQRRGNAEGYFGPLGMAERNGANFVISGLGGDAFLIDALWRGYVVASATAPAVTKSSWSTPSPLTPRPPTRTKRPPARLKSAELPGKKTMPF